MNAPMKLAAISPRDWSTHPPYLHAGYKSTTLRGPKRPLVPLKHTLSELTGPVYGHESVGPLDADLTTQRRSQRRAARRAHRRCRPRARRGGPPGSATR